jgi:Flp pilus assembly protein TadD
MARADEALLCPACGARNKAKWEFCARCGESLQGAETLVPRKAEGATTPRGKKKPGLKVEVHERSTGSGLWAGLATVALVAIGIAAVWNVMRQGPAPTPERAGLTLPTQPPKPAAAAARAGGPGELAFQEGQKRLLAGDADGAVGLLGQAVAEASDNALYRYVHGQALLKTGAADEGLAALAEAARLDPPRYRLEYAKFLGQSGRPQEAAAEFIAMTESAPDDAEALRGAGWYLCQQKDFARGLPLLRRAAELREADTQILDSLGAMQRANGDYKDAAMSYGQIVMLQPANHAARGMLADSLLRSGRPDQAVEALRKGVEKAPTVPELQRDLGAMLERAGRPAEAAAAYREYARTFPDAADADALLRKAEQLSPGSASS